MEKTPFDSRFSCAFGHYTKSKDICETTIPFNLISDIQQKMILLV
jgi:hypothetical protein